MNLPKPASALFALFAVVVPGPTLDGQPYFKGDLSPDFPMTLRDSGKVMRLSDFAGHIIVLDFFAYWCPPCNFSSPDLEENVQRFYADSGGNPHGVPVQVISVNLEPSSPPSTDAFIAEHRLEFVVDDAGLAIWNLFNDTDGIPLFVVINGLPGLASPAPWEILHNEAGYPGSGAIRALIDPIGPAARPFSALTDVGDGWRESPWFGWVNTRFDPWLFHLSWEWLYLAAGASEERILFWHAQLGWLFTNPGTYPWVFNWRGNDADSWLYFEESAAPEEKWFYHAASDKWEVFLTNDE